MGCPTVVAAESLSQISDCAAAHVVELSVYPVSSFKHCTPYAAGVAVSAILTLAWHVEVLLAGAAF